MWSHRWDQGAIYGSMNGGEIMIMTAVCAKTMNPEKWQINGHILV